jgi:NADH-quinone oxidoreductase subunit M
VAFLEQVLLTLALGLPLLAAVAVWFWPSLAARRPLVLLAPTLTLLSFGWLLIQGDEVGLDAAHTGLSLDAVARPLLLATSGAVLAVLAALPQREMTRHQVGAVLLVYSGACWMLLSHGVVSLMIGYVLTSLPVLLFSEFRARRLARFSQAASALLVGAGLAWLSNAAGSTALASLPPVVQQHPWALGLVVLGLAVRLGVFPFHTWLVGLFENAPFGPLIMSVAPMPALIVVERVVTPSVAATLGEVPGASASLLVLSSALAAAMVLVQTRLRRALGWFVVSLHSTIFLGVLDPNPVGHMGGLAMWAASTLALTGFGVVVWALVTRRGDIDLTQHSGFHDDAPTLGAAFLLFGLACVGLPGTIDFISEDLTLHGSIAHHPLLLIGFLSGVSLLGYAVLFLAFRIFLGPRPRSLASIRVPDALPREKLVLIAIAVLLLGGGLMPQTVARQLTQQAAPHAGVPAHEAPHHGG